MLGRRNRAGPWSWDEVLGRTLATYASAHGDRSRAAVLLWQGDDRRVRVDGTSPPFLAFKLDVQAEADADNAVSLAGFDSLEAARAACVEWAGTASEGSWESLGEAAQIGVYASIREPSFAGPA
jgi:hypothetical protein